MPLEILSFDCRKRLPCSVAVPTPRCPSHPIRKYQLERSPRSNPIVGLLSGELFVCCAAVVLTFFIVGLLCLLRFQHVDNLGAYSIPSEIDLLIPSDYVN